MANFTIIKLIILWISAEGLIYLFTCLLSEEINCFIFETGSYYTAQAGLEFMILLLQPPDGWDYKHSLPCLASSIGFCLRSFFMARKGSKYYLDLQEGKLKL